MPAGIERIESDRPLRQWETLLHGLSHACSLVECSPSEYAERELSVR